MPSNVADGILQVLASMGAKSVYGVSGDTIFPLLDALARQQKIKYYGATHESGAAFMAYGESKITGNLSICTATSGPGTVNLLNGLAEAYYDRIPILALTGQVETKKIGTNAKQFFYQQNLIKNFSPYSQMILSPESVIPILLTAIEIAIAQKTVVHISIPVDIFSKPLKVNQVITPPREDVVLSENYNDKIVPISTILKNFKCPLLILGTNCRKTATASYNLSQQIGAGVIVAKHVRGIIPEDASGIIGGIGEAYVPSLLNNSDGIIILGQCPYELEFLPQVPIVQIAEHPKSIHYDRVSHGIWGKIDRIFETIINQLFPYVINDGWTLEIQKEKEARQLLQKGDSSLNQSPIHPARLMSAVNQSIDSHAVISLDIGSFVYWFEREFQGKKHTVLLSSYWRSMGSALSKALGAKIADPTRQVVALIGDGGILMSLGELAFMALYGISIVVIIVNNQGYQLEKQKMKKQNLIPWGYEVKAPDFAEVAKAWGVQGFRVEDPSKLKDTLHMAFNSQQPTVIDVLTANEPLPFLR